MDKFDRLKMPKYMQFFYSILDYFVDIPSRFINFFFKKIPNFLKEKYKKILNFFKLFFKMFKEGNYKTKTSYLIMGFGQILNKQYLKGIIYLFYEIIFILYMVFFGWKYIFMLGSLGVESEKIVINSITGLPEFVAGDNSMLILLYGVASLFVVIGFLYAYYQNIRHNYETQRIIEIGKDPLRSKDEIKALLNKKYHKTLLTIPLGGVLIFVVIPLVFMLLVAFTNWDIKHMPPAKLFEWVGFSNFLELLGQSQLTTQTENQLFLNTFRQIILWTFIWAIFATFSNYFLGMFIAMLINKKGIKGKKIFRSLLVVTIAVPSFVSLLLVSQMLDNDGIVNKTLINLGIIKDYIPFLTDGLMAKITVIIVNIWIGIPYTMLMCTGILMNIPSDLYESAKIDGASPYKMYAKITLPYMLFVSGPLLITTFIGNLNNFGIVYLLTGGGPISTELKDAGSTDLLITWLYKLTLNQQNFRLASVIGIIMFIICSTISLFVFNRTKSIKEGDAFR